MALRATWQRHAGPRGAYAAYTYISLFNIVYIMCIQPFVYRKGFQPINPSGLINPMGFTNFFRVGLSPTQLSSFQATWLTEERPSGRAQKIRASIAWTWTTDHLIAHVALMRSYDGHDLTCRNASRPSDRDPTSGS